MLDRWAVDDDFWIRRGPPSSRCSSRCARGDGDFDRFSRYADAMLDEQEFFIRKAIGWVLRDTARKRPDLVYDWLLPRAARASGVTIREAVKPLSPKPSVPRCSPLPASVPGERRTPDRDSPTHEVSVPSGRRNFMRWGRGVNKMR